VCLKKKNNITLLLTFSIIVIPLILGITIALTQEKIIRKIPKESIISDEPSKKPEEGEKSPAIEKDKKKAAYSYDPTNKIDPFKSFITIRKELEEKGKPKTYLETLDISQLTISAIVIASEGNWALVRDSKGEGHVIKVGTLIGKKNGRVTKIFEKEIIVTESYKNIKGRKVIKNISMKLPEVD
jgi:Tfp pilus assembly protein PilP